MSASSNYNSDSRKATVETTEQEKAAEGSPCQEGPRHTQNRDSQFKTRRHKSTFRLPASQRTDSRAQVYRAMDAEEGQSHE